MLQRWRRQLYLLRVRATGEKRPNGRSGHMIGVGAEMPPYRLREEQLSRICEFLLRRPGMALCDECIRKALVLSRSMVPERSLSENAAKRGFVRERGRCECCGKTVVTTKAIADKD